MKTKILFLACAILTLVGTKADASRSEFTQFISDSINQISTREQEFAMTRLHTTELQLRTFLLRIQASFGIEIPIFASAKIVPEVEFIFEP